MQPEVSAAERAQLEQLGLDQLAERAVRLRPVVDAREAVQSGQWWRTILVPWRVAACIAALVAVSALIWLLVVRQTAVEEGLMALRQVYHQARPTEARITGGFDYAPYAPTRGSREQTEEARLEFARWKLTLAVMKEGTPEAHHALGRFYLTQHQFDEALTYLQKALAEDPDNPQLYTDLGVAYLEQGQALSRAIEHFNQALKKDPTLLEALFNRALCYEKMSRFPEAKADWQHYLELDGTSLWADEVRQYLKWIEEQERTPSQ